MDATKPCTCVPCLRHDSIDEQAYRNANLKASVEENRLARERRKEESVEDYEHTLTPWFVQWGNKYPYIRSAAPETKGNYVIDHMGGQAGKVRLEADAEFIVRACNVHDELLAALRRVADNEVPSDEDWKFAAATIAKAEGK